MSNKNVDVSFNLAPISTLLLVSFVVLRLTGYISWSWWWVTAPLWGPFLVVALAVLLYGLLSLLRG